MYLPVHRQETDVSGQSWGTQTYGPACLPAAASRWKARNHLTKKGKKRQKMSLIIHEQRIYAIKNTTAFSNYVHKYSIIYVKSHSIIAWDPYIFHAYSLLGKSFQY